MKFSISTKGFTDVIDITPQVSKVVKESKVKEGICLISCPGSTCGITTIEYEEGLIKDLKRALERVAPMNEDYEHCKKWPARNASRSDAGGGVPRSPEATGIPAKGLENCNGFAHIRSALLKPFLAVPIENGKLVLGQWQQIAFLDFDNRPREREILIKVVSS